MLRSRHVASALLSLAWRICVPVVGAGVLIGIFLQEGDGPAVGAERAGEGRAAFSDGATKIRVTLGGAPAGDFSTCVIQDQHGTEIARVNSYCNGQVTFAFGSSSPVRGCGGFRKDGATSLGVISDVKHLYDVSIQPDGSSVVHAIVRSGCARERVRTMRFSPSGNVLGDQP